MAKRLEKGFVRIVLKETYADGKQIFYDSPLIRYENAIEILSKYKECFDSKLLFDMIISGGAHVWFPVDLIKYAVYLPEGFLGEKSE